MIDFIPFIIHFITLIFFYFKAQKKISLAVFIWGIHTFSMFSYGVLAVFFRPEYYFTLEAYVLMYSCLYFLLIPIRIFEKKVRNGVVLLTKLPSFGYKALTVFLIILGVYSLSFFVINIPKVIAYGFSNMRVDMFVFYKSSFFSKIAILGAFSSSTMLFMYFYSLIVYGRTIRANLLLLSSFSFIFYTLNVAGRDGIVIWFLSFLSIYFLFCPFMSSFLRIRILSVLKKVGVVIIPLLLIITIARFSISNDKFAVLESLFSYIGQPLANLSYNIDLTNILGVRSGKGEYPLEILNMIFNVDDGGLSRIQKIEEKLLLGFRANQFSSYIGGFYPAYPLIYLFVFLIILYFVINKFNKMTILGMLIGFSWSMIIIVGVFYFYYSQFSGNIYLILPFLYSIILKVKVK